MIAVVAAVLSADSASACSCAAYPDDVGKAVALAYRNADVVFLGSAVSVKRKIIRMPPVRETTFEVHKSWKGLSEGVASALVRTTIGESACGYSFERRGRYLVFAQWLSNAEILTTNLCELTDKEARALDRIAELEKLTAKSPGSKQP